MSHSDPPIARPDEAHERGVATRALSEHEIAQRERAHRTWVLCVEELGVAGAFEDELETVRKILRMKRFERDALRRCIPGVVRAGARVDLLPLLERMQHGGIHASLRRREGA